ncbi:MAG TPA: ThuA domain-containing protein [Cytophagaceae bacterium]|jgi:cytochrome c
MKLKLIVYLSAIIILLGFSSPQPVREVRVLVFSKTQSFRHESIKAGKQMFQKLSAIQHFKLDTSENSNVFTDDNLKKYSAIVFLSATGEILSHAQQAALQRYIQAGGGFMGIHGASGAEYNWPWYGRLVGARFESHPPEYQKGSIYLTDKDHEATKGLPVSWDPVEEWYNFTAIGENIHVLAKVNESSYKGGKHGSDHPIIWCQEFDGGRSFYTALGHRNEAYSDSIFIHHILGGLKYVIGKNTPLDYSLPTRLAAPSEYKFTRKILAGKESVNEPMELALSRKGLIFYVERRGNIRLYNPITGSNKVVGKIPVYTEHEDGLLGIALDPDFENNNRLYVFYSAPGTVHEYHLSRLDYHPTQAVIIPESEKIVLRIPAEHPYSNHTGGSIAFDKAGNLFLSIGDNTIPFETGYAPINERAEKTEFDAQRSSGNTNDLRGKILRIHPEEDGSYTIPEGNLFPKDGTAGKPEIYVMGNRNPFRISIDSKTSWLYWGEVGPDAEKDSLPGPKGYDEVNQAKKAGNYGWPYFIGDNKAYADFDFATWTTGKLFDVNAPINESPRNTGSKNLPPAQKPLIWYPYAASQEFPLVGSGGRTAMAGPVYHFDKSLKSAIKLPEYYDKGLFIYDWIRNWIMVVRLNDNGDYQSMEPFMPGTTFEGIIDMELGPDGALYILEYGSAWYQPSTEARLSRLEFKPDAVAEISKNSDPQSSAKSATAHKPATGAAVKQGSSISIGEALIAKSDCKACHRLRESSLGPSFYAIAERYRGKTSESERLANKIIKGGGGAWGPHVMSAHPQLSKKEALDMAIYILSVKAK